MTTRDPGGADPVAIARKITLGFVHRAVTAGVWLDTEVAPAPPPRLAADAGLVSQVLDILIDDALSDPAGSRITVSVRGVAGDDGDPGALMVRFAVTTDAPAAAHDDGTAAPAGTRASALVERLDGLMGDEPAPGGGRSVWFTVPALATAPSGLPALAGAGPIGPPGGAVDSDPLSQWARRRGGQLLVVDDSPTNRMVLAAMLRKAGFTVNLAAGGAEGVAAMASADPIPELVLMDVAMPDVDGIAATGAIRALPPPRGDVPVLAITAHAFAQDRARCLGAGMDDYLVKPLRRAQLLDALARWLGGPTGRLPPER
jgi:CheY-like chemotaxis protein